MPLLGRGRGALPAVVVVLAVGARGGCGFWWGRSFLWVRVVVLGCGAFPLVVGLGWWWRFPLGSVKGGGGG